MMYIILDTTTYLRKKLWPPPYCFWSLITYARSPIYSTITESLLPFSISLISGIRNSFESVCFLLKGESMYPLHFLFKKYRERAKRWQKWLSEKKFFWAFIRSTSLSCRMNRYCLSLELCKPLSCLIHSLTHILQGKRERERERETS